MQTQKKKQHATNLSAGKLISTSIYLFQLLQRRHENEKRNSGRVEKIIFLITQTTCNVCQSLVWDEHFLNFHARYYMINMAYRLNVTILLNL